MYNKNNFSDSIKTKKRHMVDFWPYFLTYTKYIKANYNCPNINLTTQISEDITKLTEFLTDFSILRLFYFRIATQKYFLKNPTALKETYSKIIDESNKNPNYFNTFHSTHANYSPELFRTQFIAEIINETRNISNSTPQTEFIVLQNSLPNIGNFFEKKIKNTYIKLLVELGKQLKKFNILEQNANTFRSSLADYQLKDLAYPTSNDEKNCISLETLFTENFLHNQSLPKLMGLAAFWTNRLEKEIENLNHTLYIVNELNLWEYVKLQRKFLPVEDTLLLSMIKKNAEVMSMEMNVFKQTSKENDNALSELSAEEINEIFSAKLNAAIERKEIEHKIKYDSSLPNSDNLLEKDVDALHPMVNTQFLLYSLKDISIFNLLMGCIDFHYSKNWGIVPEEDNLSYINIDIEGLNMPLRLHTPNSNLIRFLTEYTGQPIIPLYKGSEDMILNIVKDKEPIKTTVLAPLCKKQTNCIAERSTFFIKALEKNKTEQDPEKKLSPAQVIKYQKALIFLTHIKFLRDKTKLPLSVKHTNPHSPNAFNVKTKQKLHIKDKIKDR